MYGKLTRRILWQALWIIGWGWTVLAAIAYAEAGSLIQVGLFVLFSVGWWLGLRRSLDIMFTLIEEIQRGVR